MTFRLFLLLFIGYGIGVVDSAPLPIGLGLDPVEGGFLADEWAWALRGGGAEFQRLELRDLVAPAPDLPLIVLDSIPNFDARYTGIGDLRVQNPFHKRTDTDHTRGSGFLVPDILCRR